MKWEQAISDFSDYLKIERGLSQNSINSYIFDIQKLCSFLEAHELQYTPLTITKETVQQFVYELAKTVAARTQARVISGLKSFFNYLVFEDYRAETPMLLIESPNLGRKLPETLSIEEIDRLVAAIDLSTNEGERNKAIIETLYGCGLRVSELINLRLSDLFFDEDFIRVVGKGNKQRLVPISPINKKYITIYKDQVRRHLKINPKDSDILFLNRRGKQLTRAMIFTIVKNLALAANLNKSISPHTFRHSFATHLLQNNADLRAIQQMLGHESITTTEVYVHLNITDLADAIQQNHPRA